MLGVVRSAGVVVKNLIIEDCKLESHSPIVFSKCKTETKWSPIVLSNLVFRRNSNFNGPSVLAVKEGCCPSLSLDDVTLRSNTCYQNTAAMNLKARFVAQGQECEVGVWYREWILARCVLKRAITNARCCGSTIATCPFVTADSSRTPAAECRMALFKRHTPSSRFANVNSSRTEERRREHSALSTASLPISNHRNFIETVPADLAASSCLCTPF